MDIALSKFPNGLPTLEQLKSLNEGTGVPPETSWIWGKDDEESPLVIQRLKN